MASVTTPEVLWWALAPVLLLAAGGFLLLTVASLVRRLPGYLPQAWTVAVSLAVLATTIPSWVAVRDGGPRSLLLSLIHI